MTAEWFGVFIIGVAIEMLIIAITCYMAYCHWIQKKNLERLIPKLKDNPQRQRKWWLMSNIVRGLSLVAYIILYCVFTLPHTDSYVGACALSILLTLLTVILIEFGISCVIFHKSSNE
ncbi:MAG: hypothetical protein HFE35_07985 [Clostridia bacterium]|jgi:hypothetical protein|nr:hypothetical protein [Clostridia bacterium]